MLRKRTRSVQKEQQQNIMAHQTVPSDAPQFHLGLGGHNNIKSSNTTSIFNVPSLFVGLDPKGLLDCDSVRSPTSPLDARVLLSNLGGNNPLRNPRRSSSHLHEGNQRSWDCCKVGLGLIDSLEDCSKLSGKILRSSESKNMSVSPKRMIQTPIFTQTSMDDDSFEASMSLPQAFCDKKGSRTKGGEESSVVLFEIGESGLENELFGKSRSCSLDSCRPMKTLSSTYSNSDTTDSSFGLKDPPFIGELKSSNTGGSLCSSNEFMKSLSASEIELSEDYTCVISHGPNPKTTHIFGDYILEETHHSSSTEFQNKTLFLKNEEKDNKGIVSLVVGEKSLQDMIPTQYYPSSDFLSFCHHCNKKLEEGKDIYIYGGEKAFCSLTCRALVIMIDEEQEKSNPPPSKNSPKLEFGEKLFETGILTST